MEATRESGADGDLDADADADDEESGDEIDRIMRGRVKKKNFYPPGTKPFLNTPESLREPCILEHEEYLFLLNEVVRGGELARLPMSYTSPTHFTPVRYHPSHYYTNTSTRRWL